MIELWRSTICYEWDLVILLPTWSGAFEVLCPDCIPFTGRDTSHPQDAPPVLRSSCHNLLLSRSISVATLFSNRYPFPKQAEKSDSHYHVPCLIYWMTRLEDFPHDRFGAKHFSNMRARSATESPWMIHLDDTIQFLRVINVCECSVRCLSLRLLPDL